MQKDQGLHRRVRVAVAGVGEHAERKLLPAIQSVPGLQAVAVATRDPAKAQRLQRAYPGCQAFEDHRSEEFLEAADFIVAAGPPQFNVPLLKEALARRKHVFCEKPLAANREDARALLALTQADRALVAAIGLNLKYSWTVRDLVARASQHPIASAHVEYATAKPVAPAWGAANVAASCALWHAIHVIDLLQTLLGPTRLTRTHCLRLDEPFVAIGGELSSAGACGAFLIRNNAPAFSLVIRVMFKDGAVATLTDLRTLTWSEPAHVRLRQGAYRPSAVEMRVPPLADDVDEAGYRTMFAEIAASIASGSQPPGSFASAAAAHDQLFELLETLSISPDVAFSPA